MNAKKNIVLIALTALAINTASAGMLDVLSTTISTPKICPFPVPARLNSNYKDIFSVNAIVRGDLAEYIDEECSGAGSCLYSLTIFKSDLTKVLPTFLVQPGEMELGHIVLAEDLFKFLPFNQSKLTETEFPALDDGVVPGVLHAVLKVTKPIVSPLKPAQVVATWSASGFVMSYPGLNRPLEGKCVEDAYGVQFEFSDGGSIVD